MIHNHEVLGSIPGLATETGRFEKFGSSFFISPLNWDHTEILDHGSSRNPEGLKYNHLLKYLLHLPITTNDSIQVIIILDR